MTTILIQDETTLGGVQNTFDLWIGTTEASGREIIRQRVMQEVAAHNAGKQSDGLIRPKSKQVSAETQIARAFAAFEENGFLMLVDNQQITDLDTTFYIIANKTTVTFLRLIPLVGG